MHTDIAVVGSGFAGLGTAIRLRQGGFEDFVVLERAGEVGGTWRDNRYPGCACDVASHFYSLSFAPSPDWTDRYSRQPEIWSYLRRLVTDFDLARHLRFHHEVRSARWDETEKAWRLETSRGPLAARVLVLASGPLSEPVLPDVPGLERFQGRAFHSSRWEEGFDASGLRVALVGTGASAAQIVPEIQPRVARLVLFQRTPAWVLPRPDAPIRPWQRRLYRRWPLLQLLVRFAVYVQRETGFLFFRHPGLMRIPQALARLHLWRAVRDRDLRARLTPRYTMGCKRIVLSNDFYPALTRPNVEVAPCGLAEVRERSVVGGDGRERAVDALVFATGFRPTDPPLAPCVHGREQTLAEAWAGSPRAHVGTTVSGFPNLFLLLGPNTGVGHTSAVYMMEAQIEHLLGALRFMRERGVAALEPRREEQEAWVASVDRRSRGTVWLTGGCRSWYLDRNGRNASVWPDFTWRFHRQVAAFRPHEYLEAARAAAAPPPRSRAR